ncbi:unnamed protein product [Kuraishia capsulata CBS 1993]|uniref:PAN2-PAN3 deadenylation complex subunit PAN3 n=1 Tax=Kuraishia capsulata CBS 1993 TaxID=1382522 RepID=W6MMV9_9ASCO|nr:uncharacterized protein KUCA_T00003511001 [Kuraishia capsulata CBS 1993]CDK27533.1 unnamed protein product [Kuraishia capsulata CBS 1993]
MSSRTNDTGSQASSQYDWAKNVPCRNILIHGFCKWENKGCSFSHDTGKTQPQSQPPPSQQASSTKSGPVSITAPAGETSASLAKSPSSSLPLSSGNSSTALGKKKFNFETPSFTPGSGGLTSPSSPNVNTITSKFAKMSPKLNNIPVFVPSSKTPNVSNSPTAKKVGFNPETAPVFTPSGLDAAPGAGIGAYSASPSMPAASLMPQPDVDDAYYSQKHMLFPPNYHLYAPAAPPHIQIKQYPNERLAEDLFIPNQLRETIQKKNEESLQVLPMSNLPDAIDVYHSLYPISQSFEEGSDRRSIIYKAVSNVDGKLYALRRIENVNIPNEKSLAPVNSWKDLGCANVVRLYEAFTTGAFGDLSLVMIYDYHPLSSTLMERHFYKMSDREFPELITEDLLWIYIVELTNAISMVHSKNLAVRTFDQSKIIITNKNRIRFSGCGIADILDFETNEDMESLQKADLRLFGSLILNLAKSTIFPQKIQNLSDLEIVNALGLSSGFKDALKWLLNEEGTIRDFQQIICDQTMKVVNGLQMSCDFMESVLGLEVENARLVRLMTKLDFVSDRPEFQLDHSWSETGERYPIKLFRDYVFHQVDEAGKPVLDLTHVISCLNKLDAGVEERLLLVNQEETSCIIISYKELKNCVEETFKFLRGR